MIEERDEAERLAEAQAYFKLTINKKHAAYVHAYILNREVARLQQERDKTQRMAENAINGRNDYCAQYKRVQKELYVVARERDTATREIEALREANRAQEIHTERQIRRLVEEIEALREEVSGG